MACCRDFASSGPYIPVYVHASNYSGDFISFLAAAFDFSDRSSASRAIELLLKSNLVMFLIDGLSEMDDLMLRTQLCRDLDAIAQQTDYGSRLVLQRSYDYASNHFR